MGLFKSAFSKIKQGLDKTRQGFMSSIRSMLVGRVLTTELIDELEMRMISADIGVKTTDHLINEIRDGYKSGQFKNGDEVLDFLKDYMKNLWPAEDRELHFAETGPTVILVAGINGAGKTTSIAKMAKAIRDMDKKVMLAACDTFRAAAVEQLEIWSDRLGVEIVKGQRGSDPASVAYDACAAAKARDFDVLIVDTAGRLHTQNNLMAELAKIKKIIGKQIEGGPHETILVIDATTGQNGVHQAREFRQATETTGIFLSKLDGTARGGIVVAIRDQIDIPVKFIGVGETPDDVEPFDPEKFVEALFAED